MKLQKYPLAIQNEIKKTLGVYPRCYVKLNNGIYSVSTSIKIENNYSEDFEIEEIKANEVLTQDEINLAFVNNFYSFPIEYKGNKDYKILKEARENGLKFKLDSSRNFVLA